MRSGTDFLRDENARLLQRISRLRAALEASTRDNATLRRSLAREKTENRRLRHEIAMQPRGPRGHRPQVKDMLSEPWSRNP